MIGTILNLIFWFAMIVACIGLSAMGIASLDYLSKKDKYAIYLIGLVYSLSGIILMVACDVF